nr:hypothetical protein [Endozoicomonas sp.]
MIRQLIRDFLKEEDGLVAVEYAVLIAAIVAGAAALTAAFNGNNDIFDKVVTKINGLTI